MSLQWTLIAGFLYTEIAIVLLLVLPIASPKRWQRFFKSKFLQSLRNQATMYFFVLLIILVLFLLDAIREMKKYSSTEQDHAHLDAEMQGNMRLFRAQRNFYISGFSLFLSFVIRRLVILISDQAVLLANSEAAMRQAQSATTTARSLLSQSGETADNNSNEAHDRLISELKSELSKITNEKKEIENELKKEKKDKEAIKSQAESLTKEYDRLSDEFSKLQKAGGDKKSD